MTDRLRIRSRLAWAFGPPTISVVSRAVWRLTVEGSEGFPEPPFVIAANHHSFLDPPLVGAVFGKRARFIALVDLAGHHRLLDWALDWFEVIPVRRGTVPLGAMRKSLSHLGGGGVMAVFPEGTRVGRFGEGELRPGAAWLAVRAGVPLVAVAVTGTDRVLGLDNRLRRGRVKVIVGPTLHQRGSGREAVNDLMNRWQDWVASVV